LIGRRIGTRFELIELFRNFSFWTTLLIIAVLQGFSPKNCKTCSTTNRVVEQVKYLNSTDTIFLTILPIGKILMSP
jgi:hypothetical protein